MIISRTPLRMSFIGGGSDLKSFYCHETGAVVSTAINKYIYIAVNKHFGNKIRASYSTTEIVDSTDQLKHELIRESLHLIGINSGIEIVSVSDIPSEGTGLGSSSSYVVGLLNSLYAFNNQFVGAERLAQEACRIEIELCKKPIGKQDQYIAAYGGLKYIRFNSDESVFVDPVICAPELLEQLQKRLLLFYTGITRSSDKILRRQTDNIENSEDNKRSLQIMVSLTEQLFECLTLNDLDSFGEILHQGWLEKKKLSNGITNPKIDDWYDRARRNGAIGGKILGAGGGGFMLFYANKEFQDDIVRNLPELRLTPFRFEQQGTKIIHVE